MATSSFDGPLTIKTVEAFEIIEKGLNREYDDKSLYPSVNVTEALQRGEEALKNLSYH